jgi:hypothetical protein
LGDHFAAFATFGDHLLDGAYLSFYARKAT